MSQPSAETCHGGTDLLTSHAMLIPWGLFAQRMGLVDALESVPISQRRREYKPQTKLIEFLVAILAGCAHLQDISRSAQPLDQDVAVAEAWGQKGWADYSGISRTLKVCTTETVAAVQEALARISHPFVEREVMLALRDQDALIYDGDLTGRPVSSTSTTYPGSAFGWMDDGVQLGYQAAMVSLHSPTYGRLWLSAEQHPGDVVSASQAEALVCAAEARTGARPRRRTELLTVRLAQERAHLQEAEAEEDRAVARVEQVQGQLHQVEQECCMWAQKVAQLQAIYQAQDRPERPHSHLAQARRKMEVQERRLNRRQRDQERAQRWLVRCQQKREALQDEWEHLQERLEQFIEDNRSNPWPIQAVFRLDGGFGSAANMALLIEMGYQVYSKAANHQVGRALRREVTPAASWSRVGKNAEMVAWSERSITRCPYPLDVALERFHTGHQERYGVLLHYGAESAVSDLAGWFNFYNGRQTIEAGIKEGKTVFQMHHLKVRSPAGLAIQEAFAAFAANFVRLAAQWIHETCPDAPPPFNDPRVSVKQMVNVAANTSAWVRWQSQGCLLRFSGQSLFAGRELLIGGPGPFQLALPLFRSSAFSPI